MLAKEIMTTEVITVGPEETVKEAAKILSENKISGLPVLDDEGRLIGVVTEQDLIVRNKKFDFPEYIYFLDSIIYLESFNSFEEDFKKMIATTVEEVMSDDVISVDPETPIEEIATLMSIENINRVPVVKDDQLVGIISRADIVRVMAE